jgi:hypothetical protein
LSVIVTTPPSRATRTSVIGRYRTSVGFNPFRSRVNRRTDIVVVIVAFVVIAALVVWAFFG